MMFELALVAVLLLIIYSVWDNWTVRHGPPGPIRIPFVGTLPQMALTNPIAHLALDQLSKKYGPVMSIKMGVINAVVLSSIEAIKEVCSREETLGRHCEGFMWDRNLKQNIGLAMSNGVGWADMRKFCRESLRKYGFGSRSSMEQNIKDAAKDLVQKIELELSQSSTSTIHINHTYFNLTFMGLTASFVMPNRDSYTAEELADLYRHSNDFVNNGLFATGIVAAFPFLKFIAPELIGYNAQMRAMKGIFNFAKRLLTIRRECGRYKTDPECFTDDFLQRMEADSLNPNPVFTEDQFLVVFADLMQGGSDTTPNPLNFMLLHSANNLDIQEKLFQEILETCGTDRIPEISDRASMQYTQAVILEGLRWTRVVVLGVPKKILNDFYYNGYKMEKETVILPNFHSIFFDEEFWGDPNVFRPERFLDEFGNILPIKAERVIAFGSGKRNCFGEVQAKDSLFLILTILVQRFAFRLADGHPRPTFEPVVAMSLHPANYYMTINPRN